MLTITLLSHWEQDGNKRHIAATSHLQSGDSLMDATGQDAANLLPDPNAVLAEVWCHEATLAALQADATVEVLSVDEQPETP